MAALGCVVLASAAAAAQGGSHGLPQPTAPADAPILSQEERWRRRFPQPVLVSDLIGRLVLDRDQGVLGRIDMLVRTPSGEVDVVVSRRSYLVLWGPAVAVPAKAMALLGPFVMLLDVSPDDLAKRLPWTASDAPPVDRAARIEMALTKH